MDLGKVQYFEKAETIQQREFIEAHNNCILCGNPLELQHVRVTNSEGIKEEAHCPKCDVKTRTKTYLLQ